MPLFSVEQKHLNLFVDIHYIIYYLLMIKNETAKRTNLLTLEVNQPLTIMQYSMSMVAILVVYVFVVAAAVVETMIIQTF